MKVSGWGNYPNISCRLYQPDSIDEILDFISDGSVSPLISRGMGRSYGDSALSENILSHTRIKSISDIDPNNGELLCSAGITLKEILDLYGCDGWFLPVTPGTKHVTVGGAVASDVHGKNHHVAGSFSEYVESIKVLTVKEGLVECSREINSELFRATCGGMGLTGIIVEVKLRLNKVESSFIEQKTCKSANLFETFQLLESHKEYTYSVAWVDCLAKGASRGRSVVTFGEHLSDEVFVPIPETKINVPFNVPDFVMNKYSVKAFNKIYYSKITSSLETRNVHFDSFFYPLDKVDNWYRLYGRNGFLQYQFVVPSEQAFSVFEEILMLCTKLGVLPYLAVMKELGACNNNYLSFPKSGMTLSLDFKISRSLFPLLDRFDSLVVSNGGRVYLAKDSRMSEVIFKQGYPGWELFAAVRERYGADEMLHSLQSRRIGL